MNSFDKVLRAKFAIGKHMRTAKKERDDAAKRLEIVRMNVEALKAELERAEAECEDVAEEVDVSQAECRLAINIDGKFNGFFWRHLDAVTPDQAGSTLIGTTFICGVDIPVWMLPILKGLEDDPQEEPLEAKEETNQ